jgi:hypothetical protein
MKNKKSQKKAEEVFTFKEILDDNIEAFCSYYCDEVAKDPSKRMSSKEGLEEIKKEIEALNKLKASGKEDWSALEEILGSIEQ